MLGPKRRTIPPAAEPAAGPPPPPRPRPLVSPGPPLALDPRAPTAAGPADAVPAQGRTRPTTRAAAPPTEPWLDAEGVEAVLRRAIELSTHAPEPVAGAGPLPLSALRQVADELQVPPAALADALAEHRLAVTGRRTVADRIFGPASVASLQHTPMPPDVAADHLRQWLTRHHRLQVRQTGADTLVASRRRGLVPAVHRGIRSATGSAGLSRVRQVRAAVADADGATSTVCLVADVGDHRTQSVLAGSMVATGGAAVVSAVALFTGPLALAVLPAAVGTGWAVSRLSHRHRVIRVREEVEVATGQVASGALPPTLLDGMMSRLDQGLSRVASAPDRRRAVPAPPLRSADAAE